MTRLVPGDEVVTVSGIYGTVTEIEDGETVLLEIAEDTDIRIAKASIARVITPSGAEAAAASPRRLAASDDAQLAHATPVRRPLLLLAVVIGLVAASLVAIALRPAVLGLDLQGGVEVVLQGEPTEDAEVTPEAIAALGRDHPQPRRLVRRGRARDPDAGQRPDRGRAAGRGQPASRSSTT